VKLVAPGAAPVPAVLGSSKNHDFAGELTSKYPELGPMIAAYPERAEKLSNNPDLLKKAIARSKSVKNAKKI